MNYLHRKLTYLIERFLLGGTLNLLIFITFLIFLTSVLGGFAVYYYGGGEPFENVFSAMWWAFLRLSDPGYLGDDNGTIKRIIATVITILGYVLFMGALVAIMTNWLHSKISSLEKGSTPISMSGHFVILGWSEETPSLIKEILTSGTRLRRFLHQFGVRKAKVVILTNDVDSQKMSKIQSTLGGFFSGHSVVFRSGSPLDLEDLKKVDPTHAAAIFIQKEDGVLREHNSDHCRIKTLKYLEFLGAQDIRTIIELEDQSYASTINRPGVTAFSPSNIAASIAVTALSLTEATPFFHTLFVKNIGPSIFIGESYKGRPTDFQNWSIMYRNALLIGFTRNDRAFFNPTPDKVITNGDTPIFLAESLNDISASDQYPPQKPSTSLSKTGLARPEPPSARIIGLDSFTLDHFISIAASFFGSLQIFTNNKLPSTDTGHTNLDLQPFDRGLANDLLADNRPTLISTDLLTPGLHRDADTLSLMNEISFLSKTATDKRNLVFDFKDPNHVKIAEKNGFYAISTTSIISHLLSQITLNEKLLPVFQSFFSKDRMSFASAEELQIQPGEYSWRDIQKLGHSQLCSIFAVLENDQNIEPLIRPANLNIHSTTRFLVII